jgi:hypothetical protein
MHRSANVDMGADEMRFLYYLLIVKRRLTFLAIALITAATAWGMKTSVERAVVRNNPAPADQIVSVLERSAITDWDMCIQFHPEIVEGTGLLNATLAARQSITNGELDKLNDLIAQCARVTVPLTGERADYARRKMSLPRM